ncbi:MAG: HD domain-containing protein [Gemmatimonadetes bacterium]|nr:HD domain-containing protein [Gemmatimonadota bacterium]
MKIETKFFRTKVARRVVGYFILSALVPSSLLAIIAFAYVTNQLDEQSRENLQRIGKFTHDAILERLAVLDEKLEVVASGLVTRDGGLALPEAPDSSMRSRFGGLAIQRSQEMRQLFGEVPDPPSLTGAGEAQLRSGRAFVMTTAESTRAVILMVRALDPDDLAGGLIWAQVDAAYVMGAGVLPRDTELCAFDVLDRPLYCSVPAEATIRSLMRDDATIAQTEQGSPDRGFFEWTQSDEEEYLARFQSVNMKAWEVPPPGWTVVVSESQSSVVKEITDFSTRFIPVIGLALFVVGFLSNVQIRKSMDPLVELQAGTRRIAKRDFSTPVKVTSKDEFQDLAASFNSMSSRLNKQLHALAAINDIDRAVLSALDTDKIIDSVLSGTRNALACDGVSVSLAPAAGAGPHWNMVAVDGSPNAKIAQQILITPEEEQELLAHPDHFAVNGADGLRAYLDVPGFLERKIDAFVVLPIFVQQQLSGIIALGYASPPELSEEDLVQARQLADQVAVALSNARLIEELDALSIGAMTALARTIDAKSAWTAGHSERVTSMAVAIGQEMELPEEDIERLNRGGLLHDIGKIGIPAEVLDKPGRLDEEETATMRSHVTVGARILEPIGAYADVIPIVLSHHEHYDGQGYPHGLAGEEIHFLARVLAVPDVFDAMSSDRPYREGMGLTKVISIIRESSGSHFDPRVVDAFVSLMKKTHPDALEASEPVSRSAAS